jgi:hypothetical protein
MGCGSSKDVGGGSNPANALETVNGAVRTMYLGGSGQIVALLCKLFLPLGHVSLLMHGSFVINAIVLPMLFLQRQRMR